MKKNGTQFDNRIDWMTREKVDSKFLQSLVAVMDTAECVEMWFDDHNISYKADDIFAFTKLIVECADNDRFAK